MKPPPENAVIGSADAPWLQLTLYELAKLRKRMKKNANWTPSETMVARELKGLGRGPEEFKTAKKKAEEEGKPFDPPVPAPVVDPVTGKSSMPAGAMSIDSVTANEIPTSNRGMKLNEAKKLKRDMAKQAAQEAEESAKRFEEIARRIMSQSRGFQQGDGTTSSRKNSRSSKKRKRDSMSETGTEKPGAEGGDAATSTSTSKPLPAKRAKTETPVPPPVLTPSGSTVQQQQEKQPTPVPTPLPPNDKPAPAISRVGSAAVVHSQTPVPVPQVPLNNVPVKKSNSTSSPSPDFGGRATSASPLTVAPVFVTAAASVSVSAPPSASSSLTSGKPSPDPADDQPTVENCASGDRPPAKALASLVVVPLKPPHETPVSVPIHSPKRAATPILPPAREPSQRLEQKKAAEAKKAPIPPPPISLQIAQSQKCSGPTLASRAAETPKSAIPASEPDRPNSSAGTGQQPTHRPSSWTAKAQSQEPPPSASLAADRPRRASTARNTPAPEGAHAESFPAVSAATSTGLGVAGGFASGSTSRPSTSSGRRSKRPAPGVISTTSNGSNSAVGRRKAATRKKARTGGLRKKEEFQVAGGTAVAAVAGGETIVMEEIDDEGNVIDPDEPRYCLCNRVSFGTMIECENKDVSFFYFLCLKKKNFFLGPVLFIWAPGLGHFFFLVERWNFDPMYPNRLLTHRQNCKGEWFHLECVGLTDIPARTTKWYCPDCRKALNIGEKGEVSARGVRM